jgi:hypothetical protein
MPCSVMDFTQLFSISRSPERSFLLLISELLLVVSVIAVIPVICCVDLPVILLLILWGTLVVRFKDPSSSLWCLDANVSNCQQIGHQFGLFHDNLLNSLDVVEPFTENIDDFDVLNVRDSVSGIAKMFYVLTEAFIMLLLDGLQSFCCRWTLIRALEVVNEHGTNLVPVLDSAFRQIDEPGSGCAG